MAHFAEIGINNTVLRVIVINNSELLDENGIEQEAIGKDFCNKLLGGNWMQTSYSGAFRKNFASIGFTYDEFRDAFIAPRPYLSWVFDESTCRWNPPIPYPSDGLSYRWDESTQSWAQQ